MLVLLVVALVVVAIVVAGLLILGGGTTGADVDVTTPGTSGAPAAGDAPSVDEPTRVPVEESATPATDMAARLRVREARPSVGSQNGGEAIVLAGEGFSDPLAVRIGGRPAVAVVVLSADTARVVTPPGAPGPALIEVTVGGQPQIAVEGLFSYANQPARVVMAVRPDSGPTSGGTAVTIVGTGFAKGARVVVGGERATRVEVLDSTRIRAVMPAHKAGLVDVLVRNPGAPSAVLAAAFEYVRGPTLTAMAPPELSTEGGTLMVLTGSGFGPGVRVTVNGLPATQVAVVDDTTLRALAPRGSPGPATVVVTQPDQPSASLPDVAVYVLPPPVEPAAPPTVADPSSPAADPSATAPAG